jgi:hypothetical protein
MTRRMVCINCKRLDCNLGTVVGLSSCGNPNMYRLRIKFRTSLVQPEAHKDIVYAYPSTESWWKIREILGVEISRIKIGETLV